MDIFVDSSVEVHNIDVDLVIDRQNLLLECKFNISAFAVASPNNLAYFFVER